MANMLEEEMVKKNHDRLRLKSTLALLATLKALHNKPNPISVIQRQGVRNNQGLKW